MKLLLLPFLFVGACVMTPQLSPAAANVKLIVKAEPSIGCKEVGAVTTGNNWFRENEHVNIQLRNLGAEKGANVVTLDVIEKEGNLYKGSGRAFSCQDVAIR